MTHGRKGKGRLPKGNAMLSGNVNETPATWDLYPGPIRRALLILASGAPLACSPGVYRLDGDRMVMQVIEQGTAPRETLRPESHRRYIDVQFLAAGGPEQVGWYPDLGDNVIDEDLLDTPRDICFWRENPNSHEGRIDMQVGSYCVFFPWDMHIPAIQVGDAPASIKKIVIKVRLDTCLEGWHDGLHGSDAWRHGA